jgi:hypothetical protein
MEIYLLSVRKDRPSMDVGFLRSEPSMENIFSTALVRASQIPSELLKSGSGTGS